MSKNNFGVFPTLLLTSFLPLAHAAAKTADPPVQLLRDMQTLANDASIAADQLEALINLSPHTAESQLSGLGVLREKVNAIGRDVVKLEEERARLSPLEQQALDRVLPLVQADARDTSSAIQSFNSDHHPDLRNPAEAGYTDDIRVRSDKIASTLHSFLTMERLRQKESAAEAAVSGAGN
jgi:hypothetical protein